MPGLFVSPDSTRLLTTAGFGAVKLWDLRTGALVAFLDGHRAIVSSVEFSHDCSRVVTACRDGAHMLWDSRHGLLLGRLDLPSDLMGSVQFSRDDSRVLIRTHDSAYLWDVHLESRSPDALAELVRCRVPFQFQGGTLVPRSLAGCR